VWLLLCIGLWYLTDQERGTPLRTFLDLLPLFSGVPIYILFVPWLYRREVRKIIDGMVSEGENRGLFSRHRVAISPERITNSSEHGETSTAWSAVERVVTAHDHAFIYTNAIEILVPAGQGN
jgi:hypothetical protein